LVLVYNASTDHRIQKRNQSALWSDPRLHYLLILLFVTAAFNFWLFLGKHICPYTFETCRSMSQKARVYLTIFSIPAPQDNHYLFLGVQLPHLSDKIKVTIYNIVMMRLLLLSRLVDQSLDISSIET
jgi:hypothetical protein